MKNIYKLALAALLGILVSCQSNNRSMQIVDVLTKFPEIVDLTNAEIIISELLNPKGILVIDSLIVVGEYQNDPMISIHDLSGKPIATFLRKGRGPGETSNLLDISTYDDRTIQASVDSELIFEYKVEDILNGVFLPSINYNLPSPAFTPSIKCGVYDFFYAGKMLDLQNDPDMRFCIYHANSGKVDAFGEYPQEDRAIQGFPTDDYSKLLAYQGDPCIKPDHTKAVFSYYYAVGFDIIDLETPKIEKSVFYQYPQVELTYATQVKANFIKRNESSYRGFLDLWCSNDFIYFLYSAKKISSPDYNQGNYILKYDWTGDAKCLYRLDKEVTCFVLDKNEKHIYAGLTDDSGGNIICYNVD